MARTSTQSSLTDDHEEHLLREERRLRIRAGINRLIAGVTLLLVFVLGGTWVFPAMAERDLVARQLAALREQATARRADVARQSKQVDLLRNDPEYLGLYAREKFEVAKEGETVMRGETPRGEPSPRTAVLVP